MNYELSFFRDIPFADLGLCLYRGWTEPDLLKQWFCPKPWRVTEADLDPRAGGRFNTTMVGPDGEEFVNEGSYLEVVEGRKIVFSSAFTEDWKPAAKPFEEEHALPFVAIVTFEDLGNGMLRYSASARHWTQADCDKHAAMGFEQGWNTALDQLIELSASHNSDTVPA